MSLYLAILLGKVILFLTKSLKFGGGSAAPGYYALKVDSNLVTKLASQIPQNIIVTGTNGKTTTSRLIAHFAKDQGHKVIRNRTGSNLERGLASTLIENTNLLGQVARFDLGVWELDEAAFNNVVSKIDSQIIVILNIFRDQLDRYGEVDSVVKRWSKTLESLNKNTLLVLNQDDKNVANLAKIFLGSVELFSVEGYKIKGESLEKELPKNKSEFEAKNIKVNGLDGVEFSLDFQGQKARVNLPIPGIYHIYDFLAAFAVGFNLNLDPVNMLNSLKNYSPAFGRFEKFSLTNPVWKANSNSGLERLGYIFLIKNPAGATQVFETLNGQITKQDRLFLALNDNLADGTDVSWIWDAEFERITNQEAGETIICSGKRAQDLAVRLKYAGIDIGRITVLNDLEKAFQEAKKNLEGNLFILPTYTAMLELQNILTKEGIKKHYWKEE